MYLRGMVCRARPKFVEHAALLASGSASNAVGNSAVDTARFGGEDVGRGVTS